MTQKLVIGAVLLAAITVIGTESWLLAKPTQRLDTRASSQSPKPVPSHANVSAERGEQPPEAKTAAVIGTPTVGAPQTTPGFLTSNTASPITVSVQISDPTLIANSVNLLQLSDSNGSSNVIASMTGVGNNVYSVTLSLSEPAGESLVLQVSAAFKGLLKRVVSVPLTIVAISPTSRQFSSPSLPVSFFYPDNFSIQATGSTMTLTDFVPSNSGGFDVGGCEIDASANTNEGGLSLSDWIETNWRSDGTNTPLVLGGQAAVEKEFVNDISGDPATMVASRRLTASILFRPLAQVVRA